MCVCVDDWSLYKMEDTHKCMLFFNVIIISSIRRPCTIRSSSVSTTSYTRHFRFSRWAFSTRYRTRISGHRTRVCACMRRRSRTSPAWKTSLLFIAHGLSRVLTPLTATIIQNDVIVVTLITSTHFVIFFYQQTRQFSIWSSYFLHLNELLCILQWQQTEPRLETFFALLLPLRCTSE